MNLFIVKRNSEADAVASPRRQRDARAEQTVWFLLMSAEMSAANRSCWKFSAMLSGQLLRAGGGGMIVTRSRVWFCRGLDVVARVQGPWLKLPRSTAVESNLTLLYPAESCCYDNPQCQSCEIMPRCSSELRYFCVLRQQMQRSGVRWRVKKKKKEHKFLFLISEWWIIKCCFVSF